MANEYSTSPENPLARNLPLSAPWQNVPDSTITADMRFEDAAERWLRTVAPPVQDVGSENPFNDRAELSREHQGPEDVLRWDDPHGHPTGSHSRI